MYSKEVFLKSCVSSEYNVFPIYKVLTLKNAHNHNMSPIPTESTLQNVC